MPRGLIQNNHFIAETYLGDPKGTEPHVCFAMQCEGELASVGLKVNWAVLLVGGSGSVAYRHFYWLVLGAHWLSDGWFRCIKARYAHSRKKKTRFRRGIAYLRLSKGDYCGSDLPIGFVDIFLFLLVCPSDQFLHTFSLIGYNTMLSEPVYPTL